MTASYTPLVAIAAVLALTGCVDNDARAPSTPSPAESHALPSTHPTQPIDDGEVVPAPEADTATQRAALDAAATVMERFARPGLPYDEWWAGMLPVLSQQGAHAYEAVDPSQIPVTAVTGDGTVLEGSTDVALIVQVPTDAGPYNVSLSRSDSQAPWLADRIRPAQG